MRKHGALVSRFHVVGTVVILAALIAVFMLWRSQGHGLKEARAARVATLAAGPRVEVVTVAQGPTERSISLLADVRPYYMATLYAKVSGYLKSVSVDKGDQVKEGQVLAEIESDETDQQYASALADLENKRRVAQRNHELLVRGNVAPQTSETSDTAVRMAAALVSQLAARRSYETLRAPFGGTITARYADPGALVQDAETSQTNALPVVTISDSSKLRIDVYVAQPEVPFVHLGDRVEVSDASLPARKVEATVSRTAGMLDPQTRTMLVEIDVDNRNDFLVPGSFAYVTLHAPITSYARIPAAGLLIRGSAQVAAVVDTEDHVHFRPVTVASTDGSAVDIAKGLAAGDRIAINVPDEVTDGAHIQPVITAAAR